jgi:hypothetical protein
LAAYEGGIPIDELERIVVRQPDGTMLDMLDEILARNRGLQSQDAPQKFNQGGAVDGGLVPTASEYLLAGRQY